ENDYHKQILLEALKHRVDKSEVTIYAFVIMPNHFFSRRCWPPQGYQQNFTFAKTTIKSFLKNILVSRGLHSLQHSMRPPHKRCRLCGIQTTNSCSNTTQQQ